MKQDRNSRPPNEDRRCTKFLYDINEHKGPPTWIVKLQSRSKYSISLEKKNAKTETWVKACHGPLKIKRKKPLTLRVLLVRGRIMRLVLSETLGTNLIKTWFYSFNTFSNNRMVSIFSTFNNTLCCIFHTVYHNREKFCMLAYKDELNPNPIFSGWGVQMTHSLWRDCRTIHSKTILTKLSWGRICLKIHRMYEHRHNLEKIKPNDLSNRTCH